MLAIRQISILTVATLLLVNSQFSFAGTDSVELTNDLVPLSQQALLQNIPIVVLLERSDCKFCEIVNREFIRPLSLSERYQDQVLFTRVSLDSGESIIGFDQTTLSTAKFGKLYDAGFSPTVLYVDGHGSLLSDKLVGLGNKDLYGYYLEQGIKESIDKLRRNSDV